MKLKHGLLCNTAGYDALRGLHINAILISWEKKESVIHFIFVVCYCVCVKRITLCNCLCSSSPSPSSRDFASVIRNIGKFGAKNYFTDHRSLKYMAVIRIPKNLNNIPFLLKR